MEIYQWPSLILTHTGIAIFKINIKVEGNSNFKIAISFHSSIFGKKQKKQKNGMEWKEIATPIKSIKISNHFDFQSF